MAIPIKPGVGTHNVFCDHYSNGYEAPRNGSRKWRTVVLELYEEGGGEAHRVLRDHGMFIVKCQDEV